MVYTGQNDRVGTVTELADKYFTWESGEDIYETLYSDSGKAEKKWFGMLKIGKNMVNMDMTMTIIKSIVSATIFYNKN